MGRIPITEKELGIKTEALAITRSSYLTDTPMLVRQKQTVDARPLAVFIALEVHRHGALMNSSHAIKHSKEQSKDLHLKCPLWCVHGVCACAYACAYACACACACMFESACSSIALYPLLRTAQSAPYFTPGQTWSFQHHLHFSGNIQPCCNNCAKVINSHNVTTTTHEFDFADDIVISIVAAETLHQSVEAASNYVGLHHNGNKTKTLLMNITYTTCDNTLEITRLEDVKDFKYIGPMAPQ